MSVWGGPTFSAAYLITFTLALVFFFAALALMISENIAGAGSWLTTIQNTLQTNAGLLGLLVAAGLVLAMAGGTGRRH